MAITNTELTALVQAHHPYDDREARHTADTIAFLQSNDACTKRDNTSGHITASAWVLSANRKETLLTFHAKLERWLQPGGHIEDDQTIQNAALREALEETGKPDLHHVSEAIFDIDVHLIPARKSMPAHLHYDLRFLLIADDYDYVVSSESHDLSWTPLEQLAAQPLHESIQRMVKKTVGPIQTGQ